MTIVITGASKGIGLAVAEKFICDPYENVQLAICARNDKELAQAKAALQDRNPSATIYAVPCDVSREEEVRSFIDQVHAVFGAVDVLVNNAGFGLFKQVTEFSAEEFQSVLDTNLRGVFLMTKAVLPRMRERKQGAIITISSLAGKNGFSGGAAYCASKFGVRGLMQSLFLEVREDNIRVVTIFPGTVDTDFFIDASAKQLRSNKALAASDIADCVYMAATMPQHADISELDIRPTNPKG